jgi:hypothetical protein
VLSGCQRLRKPVLPRLPEAADPDARRSGGKLNYHSRLTCAHDDGDLHGSPGLDYTQHGRRANAAIGGPFVEPLFRVLSRAWMSGGGMEAAGADRSPAAASVRWCLPVVGLAIVLVLSAIAAQAGPGSQSGQLGSARAAPGWQALPASFGPQLWREAREGASSTAILADEERRVTEAYAQLPLAFIPNAGQTDPSVRYYAQGAGYTFYFADHKAVLALQKGDRGQALDLRFLGANPNTKLTATGRHTGTVNYFTGAERHTNLPTYERLTYRDLWPGIDMLVGGNSGKLEYEFVVRPGAKISDIRLAYTGAERVSLSRSGGLLIHTPLGTLRDARPRTFQRVDGRRVAVETRYTLAGGSYGFTVGEHDRGRPLLIDPSLAYSTYLGGSAYDVGFGIALDSAGAAYVAGETQSTDFPTTAGAFDTSSNGSEAFVTKLNPAGTGLAYSTYLGGSGSDAGRGIAVDSAGAAYVTGETSSTDFPTTAGAFDASLDGVFDAFVTKLDPAGSGLAYSTYLGGSDGEAFGEEGRGIAVDSSGAAYVAGGTGSRDFPTTAGAFDTTFTGGSEDAFVTKLNPAGSSLTYSTYFGRDARRRGWEHRYRLDRGRLRHRTHDSADRCRLLGLPHHLGGVRHDL